MELVVKRNPDTLSRKISGTWVLLEADGRHIRELNLTAGFIWSIVTKPLSLTEISRRVAAKFQVPQKNVENDVKAFVRDYLREKFLLRVSS